MFGLLYLHLTTVFTFFPNRFVWLCCCCRWYISHVYLVSQVPQNNERKNVSIRTPFSCISNECRSIRVLIYVNGAYTFISSTNLSVFFLIFHLIGLVVVALVVIFARPKRLIFIRFSGLSFDRAVLFSALTLNERTRTNTHTHIYRCFIAHETRTHVIFNGQQPKCKARLVSPISDIFKSIWL